MPDATPSHHISVFYTTREGVIEERAVVWYPYWPESDTDKGGDSDMLAPAVWYWRAGACDRARCIAE